MSSTTNTDKDTVMIDESLYSRQLYVLGHEAMMKMQQSNVLIVGLGGLGVEIAKNVILTGVKSVTLHDPKPVSWSDLSAQFYLKETDVGRNRVDCSIGQLRDLNSYVPVKAHTGQLTEEVIAKHNVVVFTDHNISQLVEYNEIARRNNVKFIAAESRGVFGALFVDVGKGFEIYDVDGENTVTNIVTSITNENPAVVNVHDDKKTHGLYDGDYVVFEDVHGMTEINQHEPVKITSTGKHAFQIHLDTTQFGKYTSGGYVKQVKQKKVVDFLSLKEALENPTIIETDFAKLQRPTELHACFRALGDFIAKFGRLPAPYNQADAAQFVARVKELNATVDESIARVFSYTAQGNLNPTAAFIGGFAAQEVQKACSGKFHPLNQWMYFDSVESLPNLDSLPTEEDAKPANSRYDGQIVVFGKEFQRKLLDSRTFIVGAGALGCEYIKNFAMMGVGCGPKGKVFITDMDSIETSNLNRQFLFRKDHVGSMKSTIAAQVAATMNSNLNVESFNDKVDPKTEPIFHDNFWESLTFVTNALDNVQARLYVDSRCVYYRKPLLEAGTLGTKGNVQVVVPFLTESYASSPDPPEQEIPICTLKNFPNALEHCIQWARDLFEGLFKQVPEEANKYLSTPQEYLAELEKHLGTKKSSLENIYESLVTDKAVSFDDCIKWARVKFEILFNHNIQQLLTSFPLDMVTSSGTPFWGGPKRPPTPITFSAKDPLHLQFIISAANLRAVLYGLKGYGKDYDYESVLNKIEVPAFIPKSGVKIAATEAEAKQQQESHPSHDEDEQIAQLMRKIPDPSSLAGYRLTPISFEKDDDSNFHMDVIAAISNLRARNYKIKEGDKHNIKGIAGKIIPAMVTTTALITGLASFELYKLIQGKPKLEDYKNGFVNIAIPFVTLSEPMRPAENKMKDKVFTLWDRIEVNAGRDLTMKEFMDEFQTKHNLEITMMSSGAAVIYSFFGNKKQIQERMSQPLSEVVKTVSKADYHANQKYINLEVCCNDENGDDVEVPFIKYQFRHFH